MDDPFPGVNDGFPGVGNPVQGMQVPFPGTDDRSQELMADSVEVADPFRGRDG